jgi:hypothetical protein
MTNGALLSRQPERGKQSNGGRGRMLTIPVEER